MEIALHVDTDCADWTPSTLPEFYTSQKGNFATAFRSMAPLATNRTHCIAWSDWATQPKVELANGIRFDTNYYYWPPSWVAAPGFFTGSGMPMRFADLDGTMIDVYQAATQMTDESGQVYPFTINTLLDPPSAAEGYYGAFTANIHTDGESESEAALIVSAAKAQGVPVVTAKQMLDLGRRAQRVDVSGRHLGRWRAHVRHRARGGRNGLGAMVPTHCDTATLGTLTLGGAPAPYRSRRSKASTTPSSSPSPAPTTRRLHRDPRCREASIRPPRR